MRESPAGGQGLKDAELEMMARLDTGDEDTLRQVIDSFGGAIFSYAYRLLRSTTLAEEVVQDVFLMIWLQPNSFDPARGTLITYLFRITRNKAIDRIRREQTHWHQPRRAASSASQNVLSRNEMADFASQVENRECARMALSKLTEPQREIITMIYFGGRSIRRAADELGIPEGTAKSRLRDALSKLRGLRSNLE